jgi:UDP-N-acetyl-D-mannosaminuronic acid dehydrogenase
MKHGALVIVESTVAPGTTERIVGPALEQSSGLRVHDEFFLGACPERVMPGRLLANLRSLGRVCGGGTSATAAAMAMLYRTIVLHADLDATDIVTAELVKTVENAYRDVNIAFANEVALVCEASGGDVWKVRDLVNKSPGRAMLMPGAGVGGHCIPKDPWLLVAGMRDESASAPQLIPAARAVNESMPLHTARLALRAARCECPRVLLLGYAYLENSDDVRDTPSAKTAAALRMAGADVRIHDPFVHDFAEHDVYTLAAECDVVVLMVKHEAYRALDWSRLRRATGLDAPALVDARGFCDRHAMESYGWRWTGLGVAASHDA